MRPMLVPIGTPSEISNSRMYSHCTGGTTEKQLIIATKETRTRNQLLQLLLSLIRDRDPSPRRFLLLVLLLLSFSLGRPHFRRVGAGSEVLVAVAAVRCGCSFKLFSSQHPALLGIPSRSARHQSAAAADDDGVLWHPGVFRLLSDDEDDLMSLTNPRQ